MTSLEFWTVDSWISLGTATLPSIIDTTVTTPGLDINIRNFFEGEKSRTSAVRNHRSEHTAETSVDSSAIMTTGMA